MRFHLVSHHLDRRSCKTDHRLRTGSTRMTRAIAYTPIPLRIVERESGELLYFENVKKIMEGTGGAIENRRKRRRRYKSEWEEIIPRPLSSHCACRNKGVCFEQLRKGQCTVCILRGPRKAEPRM